MNSSPPPEEITSKLGDKLREARREIEKGAYAKIGEFIVSYAGRVILVLGAFLLAIFIGPKSLANLQLSLSIAPVTGTSPSRDPNPPQADNPIPAEDEAKPTKRDYLSIEIQGDNEDPRKIQQLRETMISQLSTRSRPARIAKNDYDYPRLKIIPRFKTEVRTLAKQTPQYFADLTISAFYYDPDANPSPVEYFRKPSSVAKTKPQESDWNELIHEAVTDIKNSLTDK